MTWSYEQKTPDLSLLLLHVVHVTKQNKQKQQAFYVSSTCSISIIAYLL